MAARRQIDDLSRQLDDVMNDLDLNDDDGDGERG